MSGTGRKRTRLSPEARQQQLTEIAAELLSSGTLDDLTVDRVAEIAGVSKGLIFHYFPTVRALQLAALGVSADQLLVALAEAVETGKSSEERLYLGIRAFADYVLDRPATFDAFSTMAVTDADFQQIFQFVRDQAAALVKSPDELGRLIVSGWVAMVEHTVRSWVLDPGTITIEELIAGLVGIAPHAAYASQPQVRPIPADAT